MTDKQKEALKAVLELHRESKMNDEQVLTVIEALTENTPTIQYAPWPVDTPHPLTYPWITYKNEPSDIEWMKFTTTCKQEIK